jgi:CTP:molybdopterin cytidylyltransferase MocA
MPEHSLFAVILAAGQGHRFGSTKQLAEFQGESLVHRAVRLAETVCGERSVLVVGKDWRKVLASCGPQQGFFVRNENHESGMAGSIACGVACVAEVADAVLLMMADQPLITTDHVQAMIDRWRDTPEEIVVSEYSGVQGPPVIFPQRCFEQLIGLEGDQGARSVLVDDDCVVTGIACDAAAFDIDTPEDLEKL